MAANRSDNGPLEAAVHPGKARAQIHRASWARWWANPRAGMLIATAIAVIVALGMGRELFEGEQHGEPRALSGSAADQMAYPGNSNPSTAGSSLLAPSWMLATATSPDNLAKWEVGKGGQIERIGAAAYPQSMQSGVSVDLLAVSAPSASVCWVAGRGGMVLRTIDSGAHWRILASPAHVDLIRVTARNDREAVVVAADSRRYSTSDGGRTWHSP